MRFKRRTVSFEERVTTYYNEVKRKRNKAEAASRWDDAKFYSFLTLAISSAAARSSKYWPSLEKFLDKGTKDGSG